MLLYSDHLKIKYPNISKKSDEIIIEYQNIQQIDFYGMTSIKAWAMLVNYICPNSLFVTYYNAGEIKEIFIGYLRLSDIKNLKDNTNLTIIIH